MGGTSKNGCPVCERIIRAVAFGATSPPIVQLVQDSIL